jgi:hypothetical protein
VSSSLPGCRALADGKRNSTANRGSESFLGDLMKALSILNEGSTCLHEMYLKYDLGEMADWIQPCEESIVSSRELAAPMIKSIRKLLLSKSTTPAQKLLWKKAKDWEDIVVKGMDHLTSEMAEPLIQKHIFNKTAVAGFTQLVTKITTPLDLHAILLSDLTGMSSESVKAHCLDRSRWGKRIQQIMKVIDTEGEVEKYLTGEIDVKRALEIENERTGLVKDVYLLEKELDKLRARSMDAKAAIKKLDDELSKLNLNSNPGSLVHPSAASSPKVRSISTPAPVPTPVSTPAPPTKKRRISKSDKGSPGEFLGEMPAVILRMIQYKMVTSCDSEVRDAMDIIVRERPDLCTVSSFTTTDFSVRRSTLHLLNWCLRIERNSIRRSQNRRARSRDGKVTLSILVLSTFVFHPTRG